MKHALDTHNGGSMEVDEDTDVIPISQVLLKIKERASALDKILPAEGLTPKTKDADLCSVKQTTSAISLNIHSAWTYTAETTDVLREMLQSNTDALEAENHPGL